jgi:DNA-binding NarL/FixJ family response regulator
MTSCSKPCKKAHRAACSKIVSAEELVTAILLVQQGKQALAPEAVPKLPSTSVTQPRDRENQRVEVAHTLSK